VIMLIHERGCRPAERRRGHSAAPGHHAARGIRRALEGGRHRADAKAGWMRNLGFVVAATAHHLVPDQVKAKMEGRR
jgi:hypothetical protein